MMTLYGIANCDKIKQTKRWLDAAAVTYQFHDYRKAGLTPAQLKKWVSQLGWQALLNRRGRTWKTLDESDKLAINEERAIDLMVTYPALIKRPLLDTGKQVILGYDPDRYRQIFNE